MMGNQRTVIVVLLSSLLYVSCWSMIHFTEHPQYAVALPGDAVFFHCKTNRETKLRWLHNDSLIPETDQDFKTEGGTLSFILNPDGQKLGEYRCVAEIPPEESLRGPLFLASMAARLTMAYMDDFIPERPETIEVFENNDVLIGCNAPTSNPPAFIQFYKDRKAIRENDHSRLINGETLLLVNVTVEDEGNYVCSASNHITNEKKMSPNHAMLKVKNSNSPEKARLSFRPQESYDVLEGENLTIPCIATGYPKPEVVWTRLGGFTEDSINVGNNPGCLKIVNASESDSGDYMCAIFNGSRRFLRKTTVIVLTPPKFIHLPHLGNYPVDEGSELFLHCQASGIPVPSTKWFYNGLPILKQGHKKLQRNGTLHIPFVRKDDEGIYQCFVANSLGMNFTVLKLAVNTNESLSDEDINQWYQPELLDHLPTVSPSEPNVTQTSADSVQISWTMPVNEASLTGEIMPVQFFKIQFREFYKGKRSQWRTMDDIINPMARSFEIIGLKTEVKYRFRVVAVFANNDNLPGPLSERFKLSKEERFEGESGNRSPPRTAPRIVDVLPLGETSLRVGWQMNRVSQIEGYFIYIREKGAKEVDKVTMIGHASHSYTFENLKPGTSYHIRVEAFNFYGTSPSSPAITRATLPLNDHANNIDDEEPTKNKTVIHQDAKLNDNVTKQTDQEMLEDDQVAFYLTIGGAIVGVVLMLVVFCSLIACFRSHRIRKTFSKTNVAIHEKYLDPAQQISLKSTAKTNTHYHIGESSSDIDTNTDLPPSYYQSDQQIYSENTCQTAETSFSSPNRHSSHQLIGMSSPSMNMVGIPLSQDHFSRNPNVVTSPMMTMMDKSAGERTSLGFEEYTDEPSGNTWKRRRKSEHYV